MLPKPQVLALHLSMQKGCKAMSKKRSPNGLIEAQTLVQKNKERRCPN